MEVKQTHQVVRCNRCGSLNQKKVTDHGVICRKCGKEVSFVVFPSGSLPPQAVSLSLEYNKETEYLGTEEGKKDSKEWKEIVKGEKKELSKKKEEHYNFEDMFKKEKKK